MSHDINPFSSPAQPAEERLRGPPGKVTAVAISLMVSAVVNFLYAASVLLVSLAGIHDPEPLPQQFKGNAMMEFTWSLQAQQSMGEVVGTFVAMVISSVVMLLGGLQMQRLKTFPLVVASAIVSMVPCINILGCCCVGQGVGIAALVILFQADVRPLFAASSRAPHDQQFNQQP